MKLFIGRHGQASFNAPSDRERPLTQAGIEVSKSLISSHAEKFSGLDVILSSQLTRAQQTAAIYADVLGVPLESKEFLAPDIEPADVLKRLALEYSDQSVLIVSHQPLVGDLVSLLCYGNVYESHPFATSEIVLIECELLASGIGELTADFLPQ